LVNNTGNRRARAESSNYVAFAGANWEEIDWG